MILGYGFCGSAKYLIRCCLNSSMRKGLSVNDITRVSSSHCQQTGANGVAANTPSSQKSPSRLLFLRHLGLRRNNRDEATIRSVAVAPQTPPGHSGSSLMNSEEMGAAQRKNVGALSLRKTLTNIFHLKPPSRNYHGCNQSCETVTEETADSRRKHNVGRGGLMSRLTAKRNKTVVPPGKRALPPVPSLPSSHAVVTSRTPSPQQLTPAAADRVPSPAAASLDAADWPEDGGSGAWLPAGLVVDRSPELAQVGTPGTASPATLQSQKDFAASIEKVKDVSVMVSYIYLPVPGYYNNDKYGTSPALCHCVELNLGWYLCKCRIRHRKGTSSNVVG
jgi:hypothetical protein